MKSLPGLLLLAAVVAAIPSMQGFGQVAVDTTFTYQGQLKRGALPVSEACDFTFTLFAASSGGAPIGAAQSALGLPVTNGLFSARLNFGVNAFLGDQRFVQVAVRCPGDGAPITLSPRYALTAAPYASTALRTVGVDGNSLDTPDRSRTNVVSVSNNGRVNMTQGGLLVFDEARQGINLTSDHIELNEVTSEDPVYSYSSADDTHNFYTDGANRLVITANGDVGVGTRTPAARLHIAGAAGVDGLMFPDGTLQTTAALGGGGGSLWSQTGSDIYYTAGRVGIGTSAPQAKLQLAGVNANLLMYENGGSPFLALGDSDSIVGWLQWSSPNDRLDLYTYGHDYPIAIGPIGTGGVFVDTDSHGGNVGIGTTAPVSKLHITGPNNAVTGAILTLEGSTTDGAESGRIRFGESTGDLRGAFIRYDGVSNKLHLGTHQTANSDPAADVNSITLSRINGAVGIGTDAPAYPLHIGAETRIDARIGVQTAPSTDATLKLTGSTVYGIKATTPNALGAAVFGEATDTAGFAYGVYGNTTGRGAGVLGHGVEKGVHGTCFTAGGAGVYGENSAVGTGVFGKVTSSGVNYGVHGESSSTSGYGGHFINTSSDGTALYAQSAGAGTSDATLQVHNTQVNAGMAAYITSVGSYATVHAKNDGTGEVLWLSKNNAEGEFIVAFDEVANRRVFSVDKDGWTKVSVLEIVGGADLSEQFDVTGEDENVAPGMVVTIDAANPGKLALASTAYDRKVAGVVSGAGGVRPGMLMGQQGTMADGRHPIALTGRVWTWCDASNGPIEPGDLLTTSAKPGHAMKVSDHQKAQGAIIGKAMSSLEADSGLVLILVSLQ